MENAAVICKQLEIRCIGAILFASGEGAYRSCAVKEKGVGRHVPC